METVMVTGATGFCATHLLARLRHEPDVTVVGVARCAPRREQQEVWDDFAIADVCDKDALQCVVRSVRPDLIFHLAARHTGSPDELLMSIVDASANLLDAARNYAPAAGILMVGSAAEYGAVAGPDLPVKETHPCAPSDAYGAAKYAATRVALDYAHRFGTRVVIARPFNIIGAGVPQSLVVGACIERLRHAIRADPPTLRVGNLETQRDFIAVEDVVDAYVRIARGGFWGEVINLCSGKPRSIGSIVTSLVQLSGENVAIEVDPALARTSDVPMSYGSWEKARQLFGFMPATSFEQALASAWNVAA